MLGKSFKVFHHQSSLFLLCQPPSIVFVFVFVYVFVFVFVFEVAVCPMADDLKANQALFQVAGRKELRASQAVEAGPAQTNRRRSRIGFKSQQCWRARLPGRRSLGQGHLGPHNILTIVKPIVYCFLFLLKGI